MKLSEEDIGHIRTGALFLACSVDPLWCIEQADRALAYMRSQQTEAVLLQVDELPEEALVITLGFVNNGLPLSELRPPGGEFIHSLRLVEKAVGREAVGVIPMAGANVNALVPILTGMQLGIPIIDADPQGRVFPRLHQSVFTLAGLPAGPLAATGPTGESALLDVTNPSQAERLVRALAAEFGGWAATAMSPMTAKSLETHGLLGTVSRLLRIGKILNSEAVTEQKYEELRRHEGVTRIIRARVIDIAGLSRPNAPGQSDRPSSVVLVEESQNRIVQIEIQNELLMVLVDGVVAAVMPDIITMLHPDDASVASLEDVWVGNTLDIAILPAAKPWYSSEGLRLAGPEAQQLQLRGRWGRAHT